MKQSEVPWQRAAARVVKPGERRERHRIQHSPCTLAEPPLPPDLAIVEEWDAGLVSADPLAGEIARTLLALAELRSPSVALCVGEGGSGGAMALGHADRLLLLYRDRARAPELTGALRITAPDLLRLSVIDAVVPETVAAVRQAIAVAFDQARTCGPRASQARRVPFSHGGGRSQRPAAGRGGHARDIDQILDRQPDPVARARHTRDEGRHRHNLQAGQRAAGRADANLAAAQRIN